MPGFRAVSNGTVVRERSASSSSSTMASMRWGLSMALSLRRQDEQNDVEQDDADGHAHRRQPEGATVDELAHHRRATGEPRQRNQRERDAERKDDLAQHQGVGGVDADGEYDQGWDECDDPPYDHRYAVVQQPGHDLRAGVGAHGGGGQPGGEKA